MATVRPFPAVRPAPAVAARVAAVPYDVVDVDEARVLARDPLSFLHVSRAEIDLPPGTNPYTEEVYRAAAERYRALKRDAPFVQDEPSIYLYRVRGATHVQTGVAACYALEEYDSGVIRKHERTRPDKEDDRTHHLLALRAQTGPVFLVYRPAPVIDEAVARQSAEPPLVDFEASDGVRHSMWRMSGASATSVVQAFTCVQALYIADGHHRAASAARARQTLGAAGEAAAGLLGVAFPANQVHILPYNRAVKDLGGRSPEALLRELKLRFRVSAGSPNPSDKGQVSMYLAGRWYRIDLSNPNPVRGNAIESLDCSVLQEQVLRPVLGIRDVRTDPRIQFVGGMRGTEELERLVNSGRADVAFSLHPVSVDELMTVSDAGEMMPPKSTWFEPKIRDGLLVHEL